MALQLQVTPREILLIGKRAGERRGEAGEEEEGADAKPLAGPRSTCG